MSGEAFSEDLSKRLGDIVNLAVLGLDPKPGRIVHVAPGAQVAHDDCCDGQLWSRLVNLQPSAVAANAKPGLDPCQVPFFVATVELGIVRCAATLDDQGRAPSADKITLDGLQSLADMGALLATLKCLGTVRSLIGWTPTGPEGGCHGGFWTFTLLLDNCIDCEEPEAGGEDG